MKSFCDKAHMGMVEKGRFSVVSFLLYFLRGGEENGENI